MLLSLAKITNLRAIHNIRTSSLKDMQLLSLAKITNLRAIHNGNGLLRQAKRVVVVGQNYKFESNSQLAQRVRLPYPSCCRWPKLQI